MVTAEAVRELIRERFPELWAVVDHDGEVLLHNDLGAISAVVQAAIDSGDRARVERYFALADELQISGDPRVRNAVAVSLLENIEFKGIRGEQAKRLLPQRVRNEMVELDVYMSELLGEQWREGRARRNWPAS